MRYLLIICTGLLFSTCSKEPSTLVPTTHTEQLAILTVNGQSLLADGLAKAEVIFKFDSSSIFQGRLVTFSASPVGFFSNSSTTQVVPLDQKGEARVFVSSHTEGVSYIRASIGSINAVTSTNFLKATALDTLSISVVKDSVMADNYSYAEIVAKTMTPGDIQSRHIKFVVDRGAFSNGQQEYNANFGLDGTVRVFIKHSRSELVRIVATVNGNYSKELTLFFNPSFPEQILIEPDSLTLSNNIGSHTAVTAKLLRSNGVVSENQLVIFYDSTAKGTSIGTFVNTTKSDALGRATTEYFIQDTSYHGFIYIKGYVQTSTERVIGVNRILKN